MKSQHVFCGSELPTPIVIAGKHIERGGELRDSRAPFEPEPVGEDGGMFDRLFPLVYQELHRMAERSLRRESRQQTLQPTALIHETYIRLANYGRANYQDRMHFFAVAARVMRQILVDYARARATAKRGGCIRISLDEKRDCAPEKDHIAIALDDALDALATVDERKARFVEMRFFGGMTAEEIAECTQISVHIVRHELRIAQAWLRRQMEG
jgi:RNA polymerase sigma factor (TIGR02999 family)